MTHEPGTDTRERARPAPERSLAPVVPRPAGDIPRRAAGRHKLRRVGWEDRPVCQSGRAGGCPRHRADRALPWAARDSAAARWWLHFWRRPLCPWASRLAGHGRWGCANRPCAA